MTTQTEIANSKQDVQPPLPIKNYKWPLVLAVLVILAIVSAVIVITPARAEHLEATSAPWGLADLYAINSPVDSQRALEATSAPWGLTDLRNK